MEDRNDFNPDELLERAVDAVFRDPIPGELPPERVAQLVAIVRRAAQEPHPVTLMERIKNMRWTTHIAVAATILLALGGLVSWYVPGGGATVALADMAEAITGIRTATWKTTRTIKGPQGQPETITENGMFMAPGHERVEEQRGKGLASIVIVDAQKERMISLVPAAKMAIVADFKGPKGQPSPLARTFADLQETITAAQRGKGLTVERLGRETIDGRRTEVFRMMYDNPTMKFSMETKIWADVKTSLPVRVERVGRGDPEFHGVMTDFRVGVDLDPALFSVDVPNDYHLQHQMQLDLSKGPFRIIAEVFGLAAENNGGVFPAALHGEQGIDGIMKRAGEKMQKKFEKEGFQKLPKEVIERLRKQSDKAMKMAAGIAGLAAITHNGDWHYAGKDVKLGTPNRPIFWCKFIKSYQVIYADLSVKEVSPKNVPKVPQSEGSPQQK
jgi:hypothetical protein